MKNKINEKKYMPGAADEKKTTSDGRVVTKEEYIKEVKAKLQILLEAEKEGIPVLDMDMSQLKTLIDERKTNNPIMDLNIQCGKGD